MVPGRGELVEHLDPPGDIPVIVATPPFRLATSEVYAAWDRLGGPRSNRALDPPPAMADSSGSWSTTSNRQPRPSSHGWRFREAIEGALGIPVALAGSGASYVALPPVGTDLVETAAAVRSAVPEAAVWCARCVDYGVSVAV